MKIGTIAGIIVLVVLAVIVFVGVFGYSYFNGLQTEIVQKENQLNAQYQDNQNYLSSYISGFYEQTGLANLKSDKMNQILTDAVKGRYEGSGGYSSQGAMFSAIVEAYPQLDLNIYDKIVRYVQSQRAGYRDRQSKLLDMLRSYDTFRQSGFVQSFWLKNVIGAPTENLVARIGTQKSTGKDALDQMYLIVLTEDTKEAYKTGTMGPLQVPTVEPRPQNNSPALQNTPNNKPVPTPRKK